MASIYISFSLYSDTGRCEKNNQLSFLMNWSIYGIEEKSTSPLETIASFFIYYVDTNIPPQGDMYGYLKKKNGKKKSSELTLLKWFNLIFMPDNLTWEIQTW